MPHWQFSTIHLLSALLDFGQSARYLISGINFISINIYLLKVNNRNTWKRCEICLKLTIKTLEWRQWHCSGVFIVNFEHISLFSSVFIVDFEKVNLNWDDGLTIYGTSTEIGGLLLACTQ